MKSKGTPLFRKVIVPWYDSEFVCYGVIASMVSVFLFGVCGLVVACERVDQSGIVWVPLVLSLLSLFVAASTVLRLIRRSARVGSSDL